MDVTRAQHAPLQIAELVEHEQWMVAGAGEVAVVGGAFLFAMGRADARIHIEHDGARRTPTVNGVDPLPRETSERGKVLVARQPLGLEPPHLAGRGRVALDSLAADNPAHRRITPQPVGVVDVFVSRKPTKHRLAQHTDKIMATVPTRATINQVLLRHGHQAECVIKLAIGQQARIGGDAGTVELELEAAVEIEPESIGLGFTRRLNHLRPRSIKQDAKSYGSNGFGAGQFNGSSGKCGFIRDVTEMVPWPFFAGSAKITGTAPRAHRCET